MRIQGLEHVCSIAHVHSFSHIDAETFRRELKKLSDESGLHQLMVVGPHQRDAKRALRQLRQKYPGRCDILASFNTGHGGKTEVWMFLRNFRDLKGEKFLPHNSLEP